MAAARRLGCSTSGVETVILKAFRHIAVVYTAQRAIKFVVKVHHE
jgi:stage V sporulation protein SpoVS